MNRKTLLAAAGALGTLVGIVILDTARIGDDDMSCCEPVLTLARAVKAGEARPADAGTAGHAAIRIDGAPLARFPSITVTGTRRIAARGPDRADEAEPADDEHDQDRTAEDLAAYERELHTDDHQALRWQGP